MLRSLKEFVMEWIKFLGWLSLPLIVVSIWTLAIILERYFYYRKRLVSKNNIEGQGSYLRKIYDQSDHESSAKVSDIEKAQTSRQKWSKDLDEYFLAESKVAKSVDNLRGALEEKAMEILFHLNMRLETLATLAKVSPLLGLLGTVVGLVKIFMNFSIQSMQSMQAGQSGAFDPQKLLADGIYQALLTTVAGLVIAIPGIAFHRYFLNKIDETEFHLEQYISRLLRLYRNRD